MELVEKAATAAVVIVVALQLVFARTVVQTLMALPATHATWQRRLRYQGRHWR